jgi:UDP-N-acetylglucosamine--N-acetylmuramyl-(pentapeptide) pyrophosphoryl-undecaprenol N-acetylglucosamine transferase
LTPLKIIISGGGTGGHIYPALAIANGLKAHSPQADLLFVGALGRMEMEKVPLAGYSIKGLPIQGIQRSLTLKNLQVPFKLARSVWMARDIVKQFQPQVCVGVGGYASGPLLLAASWMGVPSLIQEQNSYAGLTNKWLAGMARTICVAYPDMERFFPIEKLVLTGNPVRKDIVFSYKKREEGLTYFGLDGNARTLLVMGGSLGATSINEGITAGLSQLLNDGFQVVWQTGKTHFQQIRASVPQHPSLKVFDFIGPMDLAYAVADAVVSRAGALSISELCMAAKPVILVPSPHVAEDHQTQNAMALVKEEAALLVTDSHAREQLVTEVLNLLKDEGLQERLSQNIEKFAQPEATDKIVTEILRLIHKSN